MLRDGDRVAKPGQVRDIEQHRGRLLAIAVGAGQLSRDFFAKQVFVADIGQHQLVAYLQRRLHLGAAAHVAQRDGHHGDKPVQAGRHEFAERHQVVLAVLVIRSRRAVGRDAHGRIVEALLFVEHGHAEQNRAARLLRIRRQAIQITGRQLVRQHGDGRFRRGDQVGRRAGDGILVHLQGAQHEAGVEFLLLRHIALQQAHRDRASDRMGPVHVLQANAGRVQGDDAAQRAPARAAQGVD